eukprot:3795966-Prymnesium_polylepis.1
MAARSAAGGARAEKSAELTTPQLAMEYASRHELTPRRRDAPPPSPRLLGRADTSMPWLSTPQERRRAKQRLVAVPEPVGDLSEVCAGCGRPPPVGQSWGGCKQCRARYCSHTCQVAAWERGHRHSCGAPLPTAGSVHGMGDLGALARVHAEYGVAEAAIAVACMRRELEICEATADPCAALLREPALVPAAL